MHEGCRAHSAQVEAALVIVGGIQKWPQRIARSLTLQVGLKIAIRLLLMSQFL